MAKNKTVQVGAFEIAVSDINAITEVTKVKRPGDSAGQWKKMNIAYLCMAPGSPGRSLMIWKRAFLRRRGMIY